MSFIGFLKEKWLFLVCQTVMLATISGLLYGLGLNISGIVFICICWLLAALVPFFGEYFKKRSYYSKLYDSLEKLDKKQLLVSVLDTPDFAEGEILYDVLRQTKKAMNDEIAAYRHLNEDYHDYVETRIHEIKIPISCIDLICENNKNDVAGNIQEELTRIDRYVEQALYYARSIHLERDYSVRKLSLEQVVKSTVKKHAKQLIACNIRLQLITWRKQFTAIPNGWILFWGSLFPTVSNTEVTILLSCFRQKKTRTAYCFMLRTMVSVLRTTT